MIFKKKLKYSIHTQKRKTMQYSVVKTNEREIYDIIVVRILYKLIKTWTKYK